MLKVRARAPRFSDYLFIPGLIETRNVRKHWHNWQRIDPVRADLVPSPVREEVLPRSESIATEIADYFELDASDLPCMVFLARDDATPFVVRTSGSADLKNVRALFEDIARITDSLDHSRLLRLPSSVANRARAVTRRTALVADLQQRNDAAARALASAADVSSAYGLSSTIRDVGPERAHHLFRYLGLPHKDKRPINVASEIREAARAAILDPTVHTALREAVNAGRRRRKLEIELEKLDSEIKYLDETLSLESIRSRLRTVEDQIEAVCTKYEGRFRRASRYMTLRKFIQVLTGTVKAVENVTSSMASSIDNVAKGLDLDND